MENVDPTIIELKAAFLRKQIFLLSEPLQSTTEFYDSKRFQESSLTKKGVEKVLHQVNKRLKNYNNLAYGRKAQRHVAEQIDQLYWDKTTSRNNNHNNNQQQQQQKQLLDEEVSGEVWAEIGTDYCNSEIIEQLPDEWPQQENFREREGKNNQVREEIDGGEREREEVVDEEEVSLLKQDHEIKRKNDLLQRFTELRSNLVELNTRRHVKEEKLKKLKTFRDTLSSFDNPTEIQNNLVTRGCELEQELERMCRLMLRVERGIGAATAATGGNLTHPIDYINQNRDDQMNWDETEERNILKLVTQF